MRTLVLVLSFLLAGAAQAAQFNHEPAQEAVIQRLRDGATRRLAAESFDNMFAHAQTLLKRRGMRRDAEALRVEWESHYRYVTLGLLSDTGDHEPLSQWVADWYQRIEDVLGVRVMEMTHLRDIWVLNFTLPVVFRPQDDSTWCAETSAAHPDDTCENEYRRHFAGTKYAPPDVYATATLHHGFAGVVTYWVVFGVCEAAVWGTDATLLCSPASLLAERVVEKRVAPGAADAIYARANSSE